jgi:hypothetical protein
LPALSQAQLEQEARAARASAFNDAGRFRADAFNTAGQFNAGARNAAAGFNAGQMERFYDRRMGAGRALADISSAYDANQRANIQTQGAMGEMMRGVDQQFHQAPITSPQQILAMLAGLPIGLFAGQNQQGTSTEASKSRTKEFEVGGKVDGSFGG